MKLVSSRSRIIDSQLVVLLLQSSRSILFSIIFTFYSVIFAVHVVHAPTPISEPSHQQIGGRLLPNLRRMPKGVVLWKGASSVAEEESTQRLITGLWD